MPYITFKNENALYHAEKGSTWSNHKYIRIENGRYVYPEDLKDKIKSDMENEKQKFEKKPNSREKYISGTTTVEKGKQVFNKEINKLDIGFKQALKGKYRDVYVKHDLPTMEKHLEKAEVVLNRSIRMLNTDDRKTVESINDINDALRPFREAINDIVGTLVSSLSDPDKTFDAVGALELFAYYNTLAEKYNNALRTLTNSVQHNSTFEKEFLKSAKASLLPVFAGNHSYLEDVNGNIKKNIGPKQVKRIIKEILVIED